MYFSFSACLAASLAPFQSFLTINTDVVTYSEEIAQVYISWDYLEDAELFTVEIDELNTTLYTIENYITVNLPNGTFPTTLTATNRWGKYSQIFFIVVDNTNQTTVEPEPVHVVNKGMCMPGTFMGYMYRIA